MKTIFLILAFNFSFFCSFSQVEEKINNQRISKQTESGVVTPYTYLWSNGSTDKNLKNVPDGEYILSVTDAVDQQFQIKVIVKSSEINKGKDLAMIFDPPIVLYI